VRFVFLFSFVAIGLFFTVYINTKNSPSSKYFNLFLMIFVPVLFIYSLMAIIASHFMLSTEFFVSNVILEIINK
jgi:hypothetical protein